MLFRSLGGDNGVGAAMMMALMEDDAPFGELEFLFTVDEEVGMVGARGLEPNLIKSKVLINLDTEEWGEIYISCAGGGDSLLNIALNRVEADPKDVTLEVSISGLKGGHSGCDIHLGRGSANRIIGRLLKAAYNVAPFKIRCLTGGNKRNSISDNAKTCLDIAPENKEKFEAEIAKCAKQVANELSKTDPGFKIGRASCRERV